MGVNNTNLHKAKQAKNDEFYTQLNDVSEELKHYRKHFEGKVVFCNCDDPTYSAFWKYFHLNFAQLGLKKLISTHYDKEKSTYKMEYEGGDDNNTNVGVKTPLEGNGDFRNEECIELLKEADIVVTNPPYSCFREYLAQLIEFKKGFVIVGNPNAITYKEVFPLLKTNTIWLGYRKSSGGGWFTTTDEQADLIRRKEKKATWKEGDNGEILVNCPMIWFTNLDIPKRHEELILWKEFKPEDYPRYDNYMAFNVDKVSEIPKDDYFEIVVSEKEYKQFKDTYGDDCELVEDCDGKYKIKIHRPILGMPITFLDRYNPEQFEIVALGNSRENFVPNKNYVNPKKHKKDGSVVNGGAINCVLAIEQETQPINTVYYTSDNSNFLVPPYARVLIRKLGNV